VLLLAPVTIGLLFGLGRIWDAVSDPVIGYWSDRTRSRLGRRRPWMLAGIPMLAVSFVLLWRPPEALDGTGLVLWSGVVLFAFYTAFTLYTVPFAALGAELSRGHHERSRIFGAQRAGFTLGMMLSFLLIDRVSGATDPRSAAGGAAVLVALVVSGLLLVPPTALRERTDSLGRGGKSPFAAFRDVFRNRHARLLLAVWFIDSLGAGTLGVLSPYVAKYVAREPDLIAVLPAFFMVASIAAIPVWIRLSRRYGKRNVWVVGMVGTGLGFGGNLFVPEGHIVPLCVLLAVAGAFFATGGPIAYSILADVIDYDELETGERKEGAYSAAFSFALKLAIGLMVMATGVGLQLAGFAPNVEQTRTAEWALRGLFAGVPLVGFLLGAAIFRRFELDEEAHGRILEELERRRAGAAAASSPRETQAQGGLPEALSDGPGGP